MTLSLYVWEGALSDWDPGIAFALAGDVEEARRLILEKLRRDQDRRFAEWTGMKIEPFLAQWKTRHDEEAARLRKDLAVDPLQVTQSEGFYLEGGNG